LISFECRKKWKFFLFIIQVSDDVIMRRGLLLPGHGGISAFLDRLLQQRPEPTHLCVFQPRLPWRLQGYLKERFALLRWLLEDILAIRVVRHKTPKKNSPPKSEFRVPFFSINFQLKRNRAASFQRFLNANRRYSQLTLIARIYWLHISLFRCP